MEYQYYEFQAVDRPLTAEQMAEIREYSSRAKITPHSFTNVYNWGDFRGRPVEWMEKYFDAFFYIANWGTRWFMLRCPLKLLSPDVVAPYCVDDCLTYHRKGEHIILSFTSDMEGGDWYEDGTGVLSALIPLRYALMQGDLRALYIGWLSAVLARAVADDAPEPPVPANLGDLDASLRQLATVLRVDADLIAAAAEGSASREERLSESEMREWIAQLLPAEKDEFLLRFLQEEQPNLGVELRSRAKRALYGEPVPKLERRRTAGELLKRADVLRDIRMRQEAARAAEERARREREQAEARERHLAALTGRDEELWAEIESLLSLKNSYRYDEVVLLLKDLRDLAEREGRRADFAQRLRDFTQRYRGRQALMRRISDAGLLKALY